jgi:uncharacterized protein
VDPRITLITLGVADMARARAFYQKLGFVKADGNDSVTFFKNNGVVLGLFGHAALAEDAHLPAEAPQRFRGISIAHNARSEAEVDQVFAEALAAGATPIKKPEKVFWGGYSGYFADPDGHLWEVAHNPFFPLDGNGQIVFP